jgi:hypothetical protein
MLLARLLKLVSLGPESLYAQIRSRRRNLETLGEG